MRKCPRCHKEMKEDCYIKDTAQPISDFTIIEKNENLKKKEYALTQWYSSICNEGDNEVTIFIDDIVFEYLNLYVLNK